MSSPVWEMRLSDLTVNSLIDFAMARMFLSCLPDINLSTPVDFSSATLLSALFPAFVAKYPWVFLVIDIPLKASDNMRAVDAILSVS